MSELSVDQSRQDLGLSLDELKRLGTGNECNDSTGMRAEVGAICDTAGWDLYAENGEDLQTMGVRGDLCLSNSLDFVGNTDWQAQLASPRLEVPGENDEVPAGYMGAPEINGQHALQPSGRTSSSASSASGSTNSAATSIPLAGPGFQFARGIPRHPFFMHCLDTLYRHDQYIMLQLPLQATTGESQ